MKILITNLWANIFSGSEVNVYELSRYFRDKKYTVEVFCFEKSPLLSDKIESLGVSVCNDFQMLEKDYDVIWCQHNVVLSYLIQNGIIPKKIIFSSLSPYESFEFAPSYANNVSICLANSLETFNKLVEDGVNISKIRLFPNSVDFKYFYPVKKIAELKKIICVSNHVPKELYELKKLFQNDNIKLDIFGLEGNSFELIDREILSRYDCIISIGKTVQYAMAMRIPVYCYDHFGGPGWITPSIINKAFDKNFSGRGFNKKNAQEIYEELVKKFDSTGLFFVDYLYNFVLEQCDIDKNISKLIRSLEVHTVENVGVDPTLFKRVFSLWRMHEGGYAASVIQLFYDNGQGFNGEQYLQQNVAVGKNSYSFNLDDLSGITRLRLDPINQPAKVKLFSAHATLNNGENYPLELVWHNGDLYTDIYDFKHDDPQMIFDIPEAIKTNLVSVEFVVDITPYNKWEVLQLLADSRNKFCENSQQLASTQQQLQQAEQQAHQLNPWSHAVVALHYDIGQDFNAEHYLQQAAKVGLKHYEFSLSEIAGIEGVRLDPLNLPAHIKLISAQIVTKDGVFYPLSVAWHNANHLAENCYSFYHDDPIWIFDWSSLGALDYDKVVLEFESELIDVHELSNFIIQQLSVINAKDVELSSTQAELSSTQAELSSTQAELSSTQAELSGVYNSRSWKITKPLRKLAKIK